MAWQERDTVSLRLEFVQLAAQGCNMRELCRRFKISPKTGYKWLGRFRDSGAQLAALHDQDRRPLTSPERTAPKLEQAVVALRTRHPAWGGRKIARVLLERGVTELAPSTVNSILKRHGLIEPLDRQAREFKRFEHDQPNSLWQMDFKGDFGTLQGRCHPLTILDDHSRYAIALEACDRNNKINTQAAMIKVFRLYGLPEWITCDNGSPWGSGGQSYYTALGVWLLRLGVGMSHSRPHHPQTQGKDERFHRTLKAEVLQYRHGTTLADWQLHFDEWRVIYNTVRPHEALSMKVPASRYQPSLRRYPEQLPAIEYGTSDIVRKVRRYGHIKYAGREYHVGSAFYGLHVALRPTTTDGLFDVFFCQHKIGSLDLADNKLS